MCLRWRHSVSFPFCPVAEASTCYVWRPPLTFSGLPCSVVLVHSAEATVGAWPASRVPGLRGCGTLSPDIRMAHCCQPCFPTRCLVVGFLRDFSQVCLPVCDGIIASLHFFLGSARVFLLVTRGSDPRRRPDFAPRGAGLSCVRPPAQGKRGVLEHSRLADNW